MKQKPTGNYEIARSIKKASPMILAILSAAGMAATVILTAKATLKAEQLIMQAQAETDEELTKFEIVKTAAPCYIPTFVVGLSTLVCMFGACVLNRKQQAAYVSAYTLLDAAFKEYKAKAEELYGESADGNIRAAMMEDKYSSDYILQSEEKFVFYEEHRDEFFELSKEDVLLAEYHLNRNFVLRGYVTLNEFYEFLGLEPITSGDILGWSQYKGEVDYGYLWIDFEHDKRKLDDGLEYYIISMPFPPTMDFEDY